MKLIMTKQSDLTDVEVEIRYTEMNDDVSQEPCEPH